MSTPLADLGARERFEKEIDANFCVSAGAGVGKTTAIVRRVVEIALSKPDWLPRLVTFEELLESAQNLSAAAAEEICKRYVHAVVPPMDFRDALAERNSRARALPEQQQRLREWLDQFQSGAEFVGLPNCTKGGE